MAAVGIVLRGSPTIATTFFNNLSATNGGSETVSGTRWLAGQFTTDSSSYSSLSATLLMSQVSAGTAQLDLYSDTALLTPTSLIATFTSPASFSTSSLANATFTASGLSLTPNTNYWLVLHAPTGSYNWGWTSDFTVMQAWADSSDSGGVWFAGDAFPPQFSVVSGITLPGVAGDYNQNGTVDAADYVVWRKQQNQSGSGLAADGDGSGNVDTADYTYWRTRFGNTNGSGASSHAATSGVPEPPSLFIVLIALVYAFLFSNSCRCADRQNLYGTAATISW